MTKLEILYNKLNKTRAFYESIIADVEIEVHNLTGLEIISNDFFGDGFGVSDISNSRNYIPIENVISILNRNKELTANNIIYGNRYL